MCLFIVCIIGTGCCCGGRAGLKGLTQPAQPGRAIYFRDSRFGEVREGAHWARVLDTEWTLNLASRSTGKVRSSCEPKNYPAALPKGLGRGLPTLWLDSWPWRVLRNSPILPRTSVAQALSTQRQHQCCHRGAPMQGPHEAVEVALRQEC